MNSFNFVDITQGSDEWHLWRKSGIGASDASCILDINPWKSRKQLLKEKLNSNYGSFQSQQNITPAMARGTSLESTARVLYNKQRNIITKSACIQSKNYPWMIASLDGISVDDQICVEIKCGAKNYQSVSRRLRPADYYYAQIQHILGICAYARMDFYSFSPGQASLLLSIERDEPYIQRLINAEAIFWGQVSAGRSAKTDR